MNRKLLFVLGFLIMALSGVMGQFMLQKGYMVGEAVRIEKPQMTKKNIMNGDWQDIFGNYLAENLKIREYLIPIRNEITYRIFQSSPNSNIDIGKDKDLYEVGYIDVEVQIENPMEQEKIEELIQKLCDLNQKLKKNKKSLFIFITPNKANIYSENIPNRFLEIAPEKKQKSNYDLFIESIKKTGLFYYDSIPDVKKLKKTAKFRVFTKSGIHWSNVTAALCSQKLADSMEKQLKIDFPDMNVAYTPCEQPIDSDVDLYSLLNLIKEPKEKFYAPQITIEGAGNGSVLLRGGSFMGASVFQLIQHDFFQKSYYLENTYYYDTDGFRLFNSYDELPIRRMIEDVDIVFLEVNEATISRMSFGFIDYLLENNILE